MSKYQPTVYSRESFTWIPPSFEVEQTLDIAMAKIGLAMADLLANEPVEGGDLNGLPIETRTIPSTDVSEVAFYPLPPNDYTMFAEQIKGPGFHKYAVTVECTQDNGTKITNIFLWGVENPEEQTHQKIITAPDGTLSEPIESPVFNFPKKLALFQSIKALQKAKGIEVVLPGEWEDENLEFADGIALSEEVILALANNPSVRSAFDSVALPGRKMEREDIHTFVMWLEARFNQKIDKKSVRWLLGELRNSQQKERGTDG